jgi:ubiquinone/menaquinone biosynthesis C-methylase UbiE
MSHKTENKKPLSSSESWNLVADGYTAELMDWAEFIAGEALEIAALPKQSHIVDIATGPGSLALLAAKKGFSVSAIDFSEKMIANLHRRSEEFGLTLADVRVGDGQNLPYDDNIFDGAFSMAGLIFFPDRAEGFAEMYRVLKPGRRAAVSSIASIEGPFVDVLEVVSEMVPNMPNATNDKPPLSDPQDFIQEMSSVGFRDVTIHTVHKVNSSPSTKVFWDKTQRSAAPVALLRHKLEKDHWIEVSNSVLDHLQKIFGDGPVQDIYTNHIGVGIK